MIELVDEDRDGKVSFREFLMMFRKSSEGSVESESGLDKLVKLTEIDVSAAVRLTWVLMIYCVLFFFLLIKLITNFMNLKFLAFDF